MARIPKPPPKARLGSTRTSISDVPAALINAFNLPPTDTTDIEAQQPVPSSQEFLISLLFLVSVFISAVSGIAVGITLKDAKMGLSVSAFVLTIGTVVAPVAGLIPGQSQ